MGEPVKFNFARQAEYLELLNDGEGRMSAAKRVGMTPQAISAHKRAHPKFVAEQERAEIDGAQKRNARMVDALYTSGLQGNVTAQQVWLYNRDPENWCDMRSINARVSYDVQVEQRVTHTIDFAEPARLGGVLGVLGELGQIPAISGAGTNGASHDPETH